MRIHVGFAVADGMFPASCVLERRPCPLPLAMKLLGPAEEGDSSEVVNCCNVSHGSTLRAVRARFGLDLTEGIAATPPKVSLVPGDVFIVLSVRGLPRLDPPREYTDAEVGKAEIVLGLWSVHPTESYPLTTATVEQIEGELWRRGKGSILRPFAERC